MDPQKKVRIKNLLDAGVREGVYPGAVLLVARGDEIVFFNAAGQCSLIPPAGPVNKDTIFDLASLTKPLATTMALMKCVDEKKIDLDQSLENLIPDNLAEDKKKITPRLILAHCAGFADWKAYYLRLEDHKSGKRKGLLRKWVMESPLVYQPGKDSLYSDLGFIILEWVIEQCSGYPLHEFLNFNFFSPLKLKRTFLDDGISPAMFGLEQFAATEDCPWRKKVMRGSVHDENAYALGGYSGHAGLFGTAEEVYRVADLLRLHFLGEKHDFFRPETVREFFTRQDLVKGSTWALGWDTPSLQGSSSGKFFSANSVGHLGYTGTSLWIDLEQNAMVVFLTNRVHPSRKNEKIRLFRPVLHDMIMEEVVFYGRD